MATKRVRRDHGVSFEQQLKAFKPERVNPFTVMMSAAARGAHHADGHNTADKEVTQQHQQPAMPTMQHQAADPHSQHSCEVPCTHCGADLTELQLQQCHACKNVYCSTCSVVNYEAREERIFCLDCHPDQIATCSGHEGYEDDMVHHGYDVYGMASPGSRDIAGCRQPSRSSLMLACSLAAVAAASAATNTSTPFGSSMGHHSHHHHSSLFGAAAYGSQTPAAGLSGGLGAAAVHRAAAGAGTGSALGAGSTAGTWGVGGGGTGGSTGVMLGGAGSLGGAAGIACSTHRRSFGGQDVLGSWDLNSSPLARSGGGQLLATSPVIPFMGACNDGYMGLANRVVGAAVSGC